MFHLVVSQPNIPSCVTAAEILNFLPNFFSKTFFAISVKGRHDPCVGIRAVPVGEAMLSCVLLDHYLMNKAQCS